MAQQDQPQAQHKQQPGQDVSRGSSGTTPTGSFRLGSIRLSWASFILAAALLSGTGLRLAVIREKSTLSFDEAITYLAATGHQGDYAEIVHEQKPPYGVWAKAAEWKRLVRIEDAFCFRRIGSDLVDFDIHPPLYFWLLHLFCLALGTTIWTGPALNLVLAAACTLSLYGLAGDLFKNKVAAAAIAFIWSVSPAVITCSLFARPYGLMALCTVLLVWLCVRCTDRPNQCKTRHYMGLALVSAAGLLTHYHFPFVMVACALFVTARLIRHNRRCLSGLAVSFAVGTVAFMVMHPGFYGSIGRAGRQAEPVASDTISRRMDRSISCYASFFVHPECAESSLHPLFPPVLLALFGAGMLTVAIVYGVRRWKGGTGEANVMGMAIHTSLFFLACMASANIALYLTFVSPKHAMTARYASTVWPFLAMAVLPLLTWPGRQRFILATIACLVLLASGIAAVPKIVKLSEADRDPIKALAGIKQVITDDVGRGELPRILWYCDDDVDVFAAHRKVIEQRTADWLDRVAAPALYITKSRARKIPPGSKLVFAELLRNHRVIRGHGNFWNVRSACYRIEPRGPNP